MNSDLRLAALVLGSYAVAVMAGVAAFAAVAAVRFGTLAVAPRLWIIMIVFGFVVFLPAALISLGVVLFQQARIRMDFARWALWSLVLFNSLVWVALVLSPLAGDAPARALDLAASIGAGSLLFIALLWFVLGSPSTAIGRP